MPRIIRLGLRAYLWVGGIFAWFVVLSAIALITRGPETGALKILVPASCLWLVCYFLLWRYSLSLNSEGITCRDYFGRVKRVAWTDIRRKVLVVSRDHKQKPRVLRLIGASDALLLHIPLIFLCQSDSEYLVRDVFKVSKFG